MSAVQRDSTAGRAYLDLQQMARRRGRPTQELLLTYVLERFLLRLSSSVYRDRLVLKGECCSQSWAAVGPPVTSTSCPCHRQRCSGNRRRRSHGVVGQG